MKTTLERELKKQLLASHQALNRAEGRITFLEQERKALSAALNARQQEQLLASRELLAKALSQMMESVAKAITVVVAKEMM